MVDALLAAEPVLRLAEKTEDSREFAKLDDTVLRVRPLRWRSAGDSSCPGCLRSAIQQHSCVCQEHWWDKCGGVQ